MAPQAIDSSTLDFFFFQAKEAAAQSSFTDNFKSEKEL
jgi:hypothetical protein